MRAVDLFCGCGGMSLGFQRAGVDVVMAYDNWPGAIECYRANFNHPVKGANLADVQSVAPEIAKLRPDIVFGGPPCQDFSSAGKRVENHRADLTLSFAKIVASAQPRWVIMENVDRVQKSETYRKARGLLKKAGYGLTETILNACDFGAPQNRRRFFCAGLLGGEDGFLFETLSLMAGKEKVTVRQYFNKLGVKISADHYYRHPRSYARRAVFSVDEISPTIRGVNRPVPSGYKGHNGDKNNVGQTRPLTTRERAFIQTFPADFCFPGTKSVAEQLLGNAVPVSLAQGVAAAVVDYNKKIQSATPRGRKAVLEILGGVERGAFRDWLKTERKLGEKSAKDVWSWLSRASKFIKLDGKYEDEDDMLYQLNRATKHQLTAASEKTRMKNSLRHFWEYQSRLSARQNPLLF